MHTPFHAPVQKSDPLLWVTFSGVWWIASIRFSWVTYGSLFQYECVGHFFIIQGRLGLHTLSVSMTIAQIARCRDWPEHTMRYARTSARSPEGPTVRLPKTVYRIGIIIEGHVRFACEKPYSPSVKLVQELTSLFLNPTRRSDYV